MLELYPCFSENCIPYYYGSTLIVSNVLNGKDYAFNESESIILAEMTGEHTVRQIVDIYAKKFNCNVFTLQTTIIKIIENNIKNGIIKLNTNNNSIIIYGEKGKFYPNYINIELTSRCNFKCPHCYKEADAKGYNIDNNIMNFIYSTYKNKVPYIQFSGGEPFLNKSIVEYIEKFSKSFKLSVVTNGSLLAYYPIETLKKINDLQISLYGYNEIEYQSFTKNKRSYGNLINSTTYLRKNDIAFTLGCTITRNNMKNIMDIACFAHELKASSLRFGISSIVGRASKDSRSFVFSKEEIRDIYRQIRRANNRFKDVLSIDLWHENNQYLLNDNIACDQLICKAGSKSIVVSQDGYVRPCEFMSEKYFNMGTIFEFDKYIVNQCIESINNDAIQFNKYLKENGMKAENICIPLKRYLDSITKSK